MVHQELWDSIISCPFVKEGPVFPMPKEDKIRNTEASFLIIYRIQSALIMAAIEILLGHFTLLGTFLSKKRLFDCSPGLQPVLIWRTGTYAATPSSPRLQSTAVSGLPVKYSSF